MRFSLVKLWQLAVFSILTLITAGTGIAANCPSVDKEKSIARLLEQHPGGKVLKIAEHTNEDGCMELQIRILVDGTVKAITIKDTVNEKGT